MTETQQQPKIKFKKRNIKKKQLRKSTQNIDDSAAAATTNNSNGDASNKYGFKDSNRDIDDEDEEGALHTILAVDRRRKLLNYRNRGVDSTHLLKASKSTATATNTTTNDDDATNVDTNKNKDLEERLKGTFSEGKLAGSNDMGGDDEGGILAKKHRRAMEEFIQKNLQVGTDVSVVQSNDEVATTTASGPTEDEKELFAELLQSNDANSTNNPGNGSQSKEGDVGAGGAMMMGSGIAEVALPASERLRTLKETERAAMEYEKARGRGNRPQHDHGGNGNDNRAADDTANAAADDVHTVVPMNFASGPGKRKRQDADMLTATTAAAAATSLRNAATSQTNVQSTTIPSSSSAAYSASSAGGSVQRSDVSTLGQSYSHNFQLHQQDWIAQRRDERQVEIDTLKTQQQQAEEADDLGGVSGERMGFEMARRAAKGERVRPAPARGPNGESLKNEWDRTKKGGHQR
eukprot:CAMPEP_0201729996 /NCGR_PEP_ID=MMETSP0593-20130828/20753_1 /ASSEMBLY_ACC=CAM_ASM_000672 /TAXON_ID=267983 /ORGANISM="Skeletonema japonicum, Strain CCMP2506" /LENGTH=462 /DNA_ID=CAMNT_0048222445 /DNA_START=40 /DNA_END=1424 /DNA_ORIENTATION=+